MRNVMLAIELFSIYVCAASCLIHKPNRQGEVVSSIQDEGSSQNQEGRPEQNIRAAEATENKEEPDLLRPLPSDETASDSETDWEVNFNLLSLAACRKIAGELSRLDKDRLGISHKVNGKDKPLEQLQQEIKSRCKNYPLEVNPVVRQRCNAKAKIETGKTVSLVTTQRSAVSSSATLSPKSKSA